MAQKHNRINPLIGLITLLCATSFAFSCNDHGDSETETPERASGYTVESADQLAPFGYADLERVKGKALHVVHFADSKSCNSCHIDTGVLDETLMIAACTGCHEDQLTQGLHEKHCTACHDFTSKETVLAGETKPIEFCQRCHNDNDTVAGGFVYGFFEHKMKSEMACSSCHLPHSDPQIFATDNCSHCHGQFLDNPLVKKGHRSCTICHQPHYWTVEVNDTTCTGCHSAPSSVLEHNLGPHPKDCTKCHSPHFYDRSIESGNCSSCHDEMNFLGGRNLPSAHMECTNCHNVSSWNFKGSTTCAKCHDGPGEVISKDDAPAEHKACMNCHKEHTWRTTYAKTCYKCHDDLDRINEHKVEFHQDNCDACHDPHLDFSPPESGDCSGCHSDAIPNFKPASPEMHMVCENCHTEESVESRDFEFAGEEDSCLLCHTEAIEAEDGGEGVAWEDAPMGHTMCTACHTDHSWTPRYGENTCGVCHSDTWEQVSDHPVHNACDNCHNADHLMEFVGTENSCALCHADVAEQAAELGKDDCTMCHQQHSFEVEVENTCGQCHSDVAEEVAVLGKDDCSMCHSEHNFEPDWGVCSGCHPEPGRTHEESGHQDCSICHEMHSFQANTDTCTMCHGDREEHFPGVDCILCHRFNPKV